MAGFTVQSSYKLKLTPHLIVQAANIKMTEIIGQGEFGVVYKGYFLADGGTTVTATVAIKTLKGFYDSATIRDILKECSKMSEFDHLNVLTLNGVCFDGGPAPFIIMPFMTNGSLLGYLRKNRATLVIESGNRQPEDDNEENVRKQLMDMCLQVARGMDYLAKMKVVHRDLAARNCMIDMSYVIKVADFGLAESVGTKNYFRQDKSAAVKLPLKWLAPESLEDYIFSEKTDVWAYGVTSWEIFTAGKVPYTTVNLSDLPNMLHSGYRLEKPINEACDSEM